MTKLVSPAALKRFLDKAASIDRTQALLLCNKGASVIELAFVLPFVVLLVTGMSDLGTMANRKYSLTKAANRAVEIASINGPINGKFDYVKTEAAAAAEVPPEAVKVDSWLECDYERQPHFEGTCPNPELPFRYVKVVISSEYNSIFPGWVLAARNEIEAAATLRIQ